MTVAQLSFLPPKPRAKRLWRMHVDDAGEGIVFECGRCGHNTGWIDDKWTVTENKRGHPCPKCNNPDDENTPAA